MDIISHKFGFLIKNHLVAISSEPLGFLVNQACADEADDIFSPLPTLTVDNHIMKYN